MTNPTFPIVTITRRYLRQVAVTMSLFLVCTFVSVKSLEHLHLPQWACVLVALTPVIPMLFYLGALVRYYLGVDEMSRHIQAQAAGIAGMVTALICVMDGLLERAGVPQLNGLWIFSVLFIAFAITEQILRRRYR